MCENINLTFLHNLYILLKLSKIHGREGLTKLNIKNIFNILIHFQRKKLPALNIIELN